jgi:hypothetical protein
MRLRNVLISYMVRLDGGRRWAISRPAYLIHCALLRKPTKGLNCNGMHGELSTDPRFIVAVRIAS